MDSQKVVTSQIKESSPLELNHKKYLIVILFL